MGWQVLTEGIPSALEAPPVDPYTHGIRALFSCQETWVPAWAFFKFPAQPPLYCCGSQDDFSSRLCVPGLGFAPFTHPVSNLHHSLSARQPPSWGLKIWLGTTHPTPGRAAQNPSILPSPGQPGWFHHPKPCLTCLQGANRCWLFDARVNF